MTEFGRCTAAFLQRNLTFATSYRFAFWSGLVTSAIKILMLWLPAKLIGTNPIYAHHGGFLAYSIFGAATMGLLMASYSGFAAAIRSEQNMGTLESVLMTPASFPALVVGTTLSTMLTALIDATVTLAVGFIAFEVPFRGNWLQVLIILLPSMLAFGAIGMASAGFALVFKRGDPFQWLVGGSALLVGGVIYPPEILPPGLITLGKLLPVTHAVTALRGIMLHGKGLAEFQHELLILTAMALAGVPLGAWLFMLGLRQAKRDGSLLHF